MSSIVQPSFYNLIIIFQIFFSINYLKTIDNIGKPIYNNIEIRKDLKETEGLTMATTNSEIILRNSLELMKEGVLKPTGRVFVQELADGTKVELPEPEPIHTYNGWKDRGYQVKRGEHAKASFTIWKYTGKKDEETGEETDNNEKTDL
jgi:hypothetical protein